MIRTCTIAAIAASLALAAGATARSAPAHWCRQGDPPIRASGATDCTLAARVIDGYVNDCRKSARCTLTVPYAHRRERIICRRHSGAVRCSGPGAIWVSFSAEI